MNNRREQTRNYVPHPLDRGLWVIALGALVPYMALLRFPPLTMYGRESVKSITELLSEPGRSSPTWIQEISAFEYDPIGFCMPVFIFGLAVAMRMRHWSWSYWTLWVVSVMFFVVEAGYYTFILVAEEQALALDFATHAETALVGTYNHIGFIATVIGNVVVLAGCWEFRAGRKKLRKAGGDRQ